MSKHICVYMNIYRHTLGVCVCVFVFVCVRVRARARARAGAYVCAVVMYCMCDDP